MTKDLWGNPLSYDDSAAIGQLSAAILGLHGYQNSALESLDALIAQHPQFAMAHLFRAGALITAGDKVFAEEAAKSLKAAEAQNGKLNAREKMHAKAVRTFVEGNWEHAFDHYGRIAIDYPHDTLAVQFAHIGDFFLGSSFMLRDRIARVLPHWDESVPGYGYILGMHAFGLEEAGQFEEAEETGRRAAEINPADGWAIHAVTHVLEMQGRVQEGQKWLKSTADFWSPGSGFAFHNWWHLALFHLELGEIDAALALFDDKISAGGFGQALELVDGAALLWRIKMLGHDAGRARWAQIADAWTSRAEDGFYAFNDLHAMIAFLGADRDGEQLRLLAEAERAGQGRGTNAMMTREVGLPALLGFKAFHAGRYRDAIELLSPLPAKANRFGGSHAQRDIFNWTLIEAALRSGDKALGEALVAERLPKKPESPLNRLWLKKALGLGGRAAA